jgi:DNA polymerase-1
MLVFDIETDGLLPTLTRIHCINVIERSTGRKLSFNHGVYADGSPAPRDGTIEDGLAMLADADVLAGHNIIAFDIPAIQKVYPNWTFRGRVYDTLVVVSVIHTNIADKDFRALANGKLPDEFRADGLIGRQSLEAWGYRLGVQKGDFDPEKFTNPETGKPHTWATIGYTKEMDEYARQDPVTSLTLVEHCESKNYSQECIELEHAVQFVIKRQERRGFAFNVKKAEALTAKLQKRKAELDAELQRLFPPWEVQLPDFTPKRDNKKKGYKAGVPVKRTKMLVFNPGSRPHIADRLAAKFGWKPSKFTDNGQPAIDETVLSELEYPEAKPLIEYFTVDKRLGQLAEGKKACLKFVRNGRIHGSVRTNGAVTGRMTHADPNVAQTPTVEADYGFEFRDCYEASPGLVLVGCDAEGLELRCLGHYMAKWDDGVYANTVVNGSKADGTDVHSVNKRALGMNSRDVHTKRFIYAMLYGAADYKLGTIVYDDFTDEVREKFNKRYPASKKKTRGAAIARLGESRRARLMTNLPALEKLIKAVHKAAKRGYLIGLDGRHIHVRSKHSALNSLLQGAGAIVMKKALVLFDEVVVTTYRCNDAIVEPVANIHDEFQTETQPEIADDVGRLAADSIKRAGEHFKFRCPLSGSYKVGASWAHTH